MKRYLHPSFSEKPELMINVACIKYSDKYAAVPTEISDVAWIKHNKKYLRWFPRLKKWIKIPRVIGAFIL